ncbi:hypothetical protein DH2020_024713 [Rehmannia glutinosa]|uniref:Uncharacterized protein n=1 Tax=Rehmannia glutinosa TaxID=99300 RepID=A0ABR0W1M8_REHGL
MAATGGSIAVLSCPSSYFSQKARPTTSSSSSSSSLVVNVTVNQRRNTCCLAVQESSTSTVAAETKEKKAEEQGNEAVAAAKPKAAAKAPIKPLPQLMEEDVIPSLKQTLLAQQDISDLDLSFDENKLEGSFLKNGIPYSFWAFFPDGAKGFSISSYGSGVSTVEPFLVDEKKPTAKHVVFWVEKRLAAQGIIPVWRD